MAFQRYSGFLGKVEWVMMKIENIDGLLGIADLRYDLSVSSMTSPE
jgi:hypothetical protein